MMWWLFSTGTITAGNSLPCDLWIVIVYARVNASNSNASHCTTWRSSSSSTAWALTCQRSASRGECAWPRIRIGLWATPGCACRVGAETRDVCVGHADNLPGQVNLTLLAPVWPGHRLVLALTHLGMIGFCGFLEFTGAVGKPQVWNHRERPRCAAQRP